MNSNSGPHLREITVAHSPDSDDAFMFYGMATNKVRVPGVKFTHSLCDIETLNRKALDGFYDITAISFHAYPYLQDKYALMPSGGSVGEGYGPMIVSPRLIPRDELRSVTIAVPGTMTTAYLALKLYLPEANTEVVPFDQIIPRVLEGKYELGSSFMKGNSRSIVRACVEVDMGKWWREKTGMPLPLGGNAIRRDLGEELINSSCQALHDSIQYALEHREEALQYAMQFARDLDPQLADKFVGMYVNERTLDYGKDGREAITKLLDMGYEAGIITEKPQVEFVGNAALSRAS